MAPASDTDLPDPDWSSFPGATPIEAVIHPQGNKKVNLIARIRKAFRRIDPAA